MSVYVFVSMPHKDKPGAHTHIVNTRMEHCSGENGKSFSFGNYLHKEANTLFSLDLVQSCQSNCKEKHQVYCIFDDGRLDLSLFLISGQQKKHEIGFMQI